MSATGSTDEYTWEVGQAGATLQWQGQTFELERDDLEAGGWVNKIELGPDCIEGECATAADHGGLLNEVERLENKIEDMTSEDDIADLAKAIEEHHDDLGHFGALQFCNETPCRQFGKTFEVGRFD
jgi:hypothetical protein